MIIDFAVRIAFEMNTNQVRIENVYSTPGNNVRLFATVC
jgi:hypothetical protein